MSERGEKSESLPPRILVVDDDQAICQFLQMIFADEGWSAVTASNGAEALDIVQELTPQLLLVDLVMPVMDGIHFVQAYHQLPGPHAPIIIFSAATKVDLPNVHVDAVLPKPFDLGELIRLVKQYLPQSTE